MVFSFHPCAIILWVLRLCTLSPLSSRDVWYHSFFNSPFQIWIKLCGRVVSELIIWNNILFVTKWLAGKSFPFYHSHLAEFDEYDKISGTFIFKCHQLPLWGKFIFITKFKSFYTHTNVLQGKPLLVPLRWSLISEQMRGSLFLLWISLQISNFSILTCSLPYTYIYFLNSPQITTLFFSLISKHHWIRSILNIFKF